jgi:hypothetical protein
MSAPHPKYSRIMMLAHEALCADWCPQGAILQYVQTHESSPVAAQHVAAALLQLWARGEADRVVYAGHPETHWRRARYGRAA